MREVRLQHGQDVKSHPITHHHLRYCLLGHDKVVLGITISDILCSVMPLAHTFCSAAFLARVAQSPGPPLLHLLSYALPLNPIAA